MRMKMKVVIDDDDDDDQYTKKELKPRQGFKELAMAVVEQWILDGKPECDKPSIDIWLKFIEENV